MDRGPQFSPATVRGCVPSGVARGARPLHLWSSWTKSARARRAQHPAGTWLALRRGREIFLCHVTAAGNARSVRVTSQWPPPTVHACGYLATSFRAGASGCASESLALKSLEPWLEGSRHRDWNVERSAGLRVGLAGRSGGDSEIMLRVTSPWRLRGPGAPERHRRDGPGVAPSESPTVTVTAPASSPGWAARPRPGASVPVGLAAGSRRGGRRPNSVELELHRVSAGQAAAAQRPGYNPAARQRESEWSESW